MGMNFDPTKARPQNNYFTATLKKYPEGNFIALLKPEQIQRSAKERIFREMVRGQIDYTDFGAYFQDSKFLENLLIAAQDELNNNTIICNALYLLDQKNPGNVDVFNLLNKYNTLCYIFNVLVNRLTGVKMEGNIGYLTDIQYILANCKNVM